MHSEKKERFLPCGKPVHKSGFEKTLKIPSKSVKHTTQCISGDNFVREKTENKNPQLCEGERQLLFGRSQKQVCSISQYGIMDMCRDT